MFERRSCRSDNESSDDACDNESDGSDRREGV